MFAYCDGSCLFSSLLPLMVGTICLAQYTVFRRLLEDEELANFNRLLEMLSNTKFDCSEKVILEASGAFSV